MTTQKQFPSSALVYHEVMAQWTKTMHFISGSSRMMKKLNFLGRMMGRLNIFGGGRESKASYEEQLVAEIEALERKVGAVGCSGARCVCPP